MYKQVLNTVLKILNMGVPNYTEFRKKKKEGLHRVSDDNDIVIVSGSRK